MIDPEKLPPRALLDSGVLMRALGDRPHDPDAPICKEFWERMLFRTNNIFIAAPTITEVTRSSRYPALIVPSVEWVTVVAFDQLAAERLSEKYPQPVLCELRDGLPLDYIRYDAMIAACADRYKATLISLEGQLIRIAKAAGISCAHPRDFEAPEAQLPSPPAPTPPGLSNPQSQTKMPFADSVKIEKGDQDDPPSG